jgi:hypothetical protein
MKKVILSILTGTLIFVSCNGSVAKTADKKVSEHKEIKDSIVKKVTETPKDSIYIDSFFTDIAKTIAGLDNSISKQRKLGLNYSQQVDIQYSIFQKNKLNPISNWVTERNLVPAEKKCKTLFYPLAGADFAYANAFFKDVDNYILVGLEKPGYLPNYNSFNNAAIENYRSHIFNSLGVSMKSGFFRTNSMRVQFSQKYVNGTLHSLLFYLARAGNKIRKIGHFILKDDATLRPTFGTEAMFSPGLDIEYLTEDNKVKHLYYYSFDLSDANPKVDNFFKWVSSFGEHHTMLKAASYLNSRDYFKKTRNYILNSSNLIVQDDSGIPYKYFVNGQWNINLFGVYKRVIPLFSSRVQPDMVSAYKDTTKLVTAKLPFGIGYNTAFGETNLQVFYKK